MALVPPQIDRAGARSLAIASKRQELIEQSIFWVYLAGLAWVPFWYGSNDLIAWGVNAVLFPSLVMLYEVALLIQGKRHPVGVRNIAMPAALFAVVVAWIAVQTFTWVPASLVNPIWGMAADALGRPLDGSISVDRDLTNLAQIRLIAAASAFWLALQLCRDGPRAVALIVSVAAIGCGYAAYGLVVVKTGQLPWLDIPPNGGRVSSTFVNHNSFATYAGMGLLATVGLILQLYRNRVTIGENWRLSLASFLDATGQQGAALLAGGFLILVALLLTGSRGGVVSTGLGLAILGFLTHRRGRRDGHRTPGVILFVLVLAALATYAFGGVLFGNFDQHGISDASRISVYSLMLRSILDVPVLGYGYGTFVDVFPMYRDRSISVAGIWSQAHDTYLEVLQGLGLVFGAFLITIVVLLALRCAKGSLRRQENAMVPAVAASVACLIGAHALVDFSLQMQAVALTFMALLGAGVAQSESSRLALTD